MTESQDALQRVPLETRVSPAASLIAMQVMRTGSDLDGAIEAVATHLTSDARVDVVIVALTTISPREHTDWVHLGERVWLREWRREGSRTPRILPSEEAGPGAALTMPWLSQHARITTVAMPDVSQLPPEAEQDRRELEALGLKSILGAAQEGDGVMFGSLSAVSEQAGTFPDELVADFRLLNAALTARLSVEHARSATAEAMDLAEQARGAQQQFFSTIGHELRTPIAAIIGFAEVLADEAEIRIEKEGDFPTQAQHDAGVILRAADQLHAIVEDLLSTGRTLGDGEARTTQDLGLAVDDVIHWHQTPALARRVVVTATVPPDTVVMARASGLRQVLTNLIGNAIVHNVEGGTVDITVERSMDEARDHRVRVIVRDQGRGLAPDEVNRVFEPFVRFAQEGVKGTGLGLSLARAVAERDGAVIGVESTLGEGSAFWVDYPAG